jgi:type I restriction enzyme, S subunit
MRSEWKDCTLGDAVTLKRGYDLPAKERYPGSVPIVSSSGFSDVHAEAKVKGPGVVTGRYGTIGQVFYVDRDFWPLNTTLYVQNFKGNDPRFVAYMLRTVDFAQYSDKAAVPGVNRNHLHTARIVLPPVTEQVRIAEMLQSLDNRIDLLHQTNTTLQSIAQALFKSWFIDFDPVRAKAEGREPEAMDAGTAALFPAEFDESTLGLIPRGWRAEPLYELASFINGASYKAFEPNADGRGLPIVKIAELKGGLTAQTAYSDLAMPEKYRIRNGDLLFSWSGNPDTSIDTFIWGDGDAWLNQHIFKVVPRARSERSFIFLLLRYLRPIFAGLARNKQTTGLGHVTVADMRRLQVTVPPPSTLLRFDELVTPLLDAMELNASKAKLFGEIRQTLLPRLISGRLRLAEAQEQLEEALA